MSYLSRAVRNLLSTLLFPIIPMLLQLLIIIFAIVIGVYLYTIGTPDYRTKVLGNGTCVCQDKSYMINDSPCEPLEFDKSCKEMGMPCVSTICNFAGIARPWFIDYLHGLNIFSLYWSFFFISALVQLILAGVFATWYWTYRKGNLSISVITESTHRTFK